MKPITADSRLGIVLLALRAGPMAPDQIAERWPNGHNVAEAVRLDLVEKVGDEYRLTDAGRAAVPLRNPLAAKPAISPEVFTMPRGETRITRDQVLAAIKEAGAAGVNRKQLIERFGCTESNMDNHIMNLAKLNAIFKPRPGHFVVSHLEYDPAAACSEQNAESETQPALSATDVPQAPDELAACAEDPLPASDLVIGIAVPVEEINIKPVPDRRAPIVVEHDEDIEIGIFSNGEMSIQIEDGLNETEIRLTAGAVVKLRRFLGLFQEAA